MIPTLITTSRLPTFATTFLAHLPTAGLGPVPEDFEGNRYPKIS